MSARHDPYSALRHGNFRLFLGGKFLITVALQMQAVVASWLIYEQTKDPFALGLIGLTEAVPALSLALPGGILADRYNRKKLMIGASLGMLITSVLLTLYTYSDVQATGIWPVYAAIFFIGFARGFYNPAQSSLWGQLLPREKYVNASVWNSSLWQIGAVTGPALGGICYAWIGPAHTNLVVCAILLAVLMAYLLIRYTHHPAAKAQEPTGQALRSGIRFFFSNQVLLSAVSLDLFAVLFGGAVALLPAFADQVLHTGPEGLGFLRSAPAIGSVLMAAYLAFRPPGKGAGRTMLICVAGFGVTMILFALSTHFYLSMLLLTVSGMFDNISVVVRSTILQSHTPNEMRGRVAAVNSIFVGSSNEIGAFESGLAARFLGLANSVIFGGVMTLVVTGITWKKAPALRELDF